MHIKSRQETNSHDLLIYHIYADQGVESEYLTRFGRVVRVGLNPVDRNKSEPIAADVNKLPLQKKANLAIANPECGPWNELNTKVHNNAEDQPKQIKDARKACKKIADHYIIENVPKAPLKDPVILQGSYFGLPITKRRAFETSFEVEQPNLQQTLHDHCECYDRYQRPRKWWESVMGVNYYYPIDDLVNAGMPRAYIEYLLQYYFLETEQEN